MALPKSVENFKNEGSKDDKKAVAGGIAVSVVVVLLVGWAIFFFRSIAHSSQDLQLGGGAQDQFNFTSVKDAQQSLQQDLNAAQTSDLQMAHQESQQPAVMQAAPMQTQGQQTDQFGAQYQGN